MSVVEISYYCGRALFDTLYTISCFVLYCSLYCIMCVVHVDTSIYIFIVLQLRNKIRTSHRVKFAMHFHPFTSIPHRHIYHASFSSSVAVTGSSVKGSREEVPECVVTAMCNAKSWSDGDTITSFWKSWSPVGVMGVRVGHSTRAGSLVNYCHWFTDTHELLR